MTKKKEKLVILLKEKKMSNKISEITISTKNFNKEWIERCNRGVRFDIPIGIKIKFAGIIGECVKNIDNNKYDCQACAFRNCDVCRLMECCGRWRHDDNTVHFEKIKR